MKPPVRVLLVDDHAVVREGYRRLLEATAEVVVVAEAADAEQAYTRFSEHQPDIAVIDISLPGASGLEVMRRILARTPSARILIFSMHEDPVFVARALDGGAMGYLSKASAPELMLAAVLAIAVGRRFVPTTLMERVRHLRAEEKQPPLTTLSEREFEILRLMAEGRQANEIALLLHVSSKTVANYQTSIRHKLGAESIRDLICYALQAGILPQRDSLAAC